MQSPFLSAGEESSAVMGKKYGLSLTAVGGGGGDEEGIYLMTMGFGRYGPPLTEQEAWVLLIRLIVILNFVPTSNVIPFQGEPP